jgi:hypothetical protein
VPLRCGETCWAEAPVEIDSEIRASARKNFCILFLHSDGREIPLSDNASSERNGPFGLHMLQNAASGEQKRW